MIIWEFFAGSRSFSKVAEDRGHVTYTTDIIGFADIDQTCDIFDFDIEKALLKTGRPDIIWFSPPCKYFSVASCYHHWIKRNGEFIPNSEGAILGLKIIDKMKELLNVLRPKFYIIENPRGLMRKMPTMRGHVRDTVWYCQYGDHRAKPTDLWTNFGLSDPQGCKNSNPNCHHEKAKRSTYKGTQGVKGNYERSIVPPQLCHEILDQLENFSRGWERFL